MVEVEWFPCPEIIHKILPSRKPNPCVKYILPLINLDWLQFSLVFPRFRPLPLLKQSERRGQRRRHLRPLLRRRQKRRHHPPYVRLLLRFKPFPCELQSFPPQPHPLRMLRPPLQLHHILHHHPHQTPPPLRGHRRPLPLANHRQIAHRQYGCQLLHRDRGWAELSLRPIWLPDEFHVPLYVERWMLVVLC